MIRSVIPDFVALPVYAPKPAEEFLAAMISYLVANGSSLTNFKPGSRVRTLLEAVALELAATASEFHEFLKYGIRESDYKKFDFQLKEGNRANGLVTVYHSGHITPYDIPAFTVDLFGLTFSSDSTPGSIPVGQSTIEVGIFAESFGTEFNLDATSIDTDQGKGTIRTVDGSPWEDYERIVNLLPIEGGTNQESEAERETRFQDFVQSLGRSSLLGIKSGCESVNGVLEASVDENKNPQTGVEETGWVLCYITDGTASPPQTLLDEVYRVIKGDDSDPDNYPGYAAGGTRVFVGSIETYPVNLTININLKGEVSLLTDEEASAVYAGSIRNYVNRLKAGENIVLQQLAAAAFAALPYDLHSIEFLIPSGDITIPASQLPRIGISGAGLLTVNAINRV